MADWILIAKQGEIADKNRKIANIDDTGNVVFNLVGGYFAIEDLCTHGGGDSSGSWAEGGRAVCTRHLAGCGPISRATVADDAFRRTSGASRGGRPDTATYRVTIENRLRHALPLLVFGALGVLEGGLIAATVAHAPTSGLVWLAAYLVLVVGVAQFALAVGQALLSEPAVGKGPIGLEWALFNLGSVGVAGGTLGDSFLFVALGTVMVLAALVTFLLMAGRARGLRGTAVPGADRHRGRGRCRRIDPVQPGDESVNQRYGCARPPTAPMISGPGFVCPTTSASAGRRNNFERCRIQNRLPALTAIEVWAEPLKFRTGLSLGDRLAEKSNASECWEVLFAMGTKVDLDRLATTLDEYTYAYLMTTDKNSHPHAVAVRADLVDGCLSVGGCGKRSRANALYQHVVALVYPPATVGGYSLIVDGAATVCDDNLIVAPTVAVLHRPPRHDAPPSGSGCISDCVRLENE